jgi:hypothetical protein
MLDNPEYNPNPHTTTVVAMGFLLPEGIRILIIFHSSQRKNMTSFVKKDSDEWMNNFESESFDFTPDFFPLDEITRVATPTGVVKFETNTKLDKRENKMSEEDWNLAINESLAIIERANGQPIVSREITEVDFAVEPNQNRYTIKKSALKPCLIFPWFHYQRGRFRQSLAKEIRQGTTIQTVLFAMNYFFQLPFSQNEIELLRRLYSEMTIPTYSHCLTTIVEVYILFREQQSLQPLMIEGERASPTPLPSPPSSPLLHLPEVEEVLEPSISLPHDRSLRGSDEESLSKRARTNEWAIRKNSELIEFYQATDPILFKDLIENLHKAIADLRADGLRLTETDSGSPRLE